MRSHLMAILGAALLFALGCSDRRLNQEIGGQGGTVSGTGGASGGSGGTSGAPGGTGGASATGGSSGTGGGSGGISGGTCDAGAWCMGVPDAAGCCPPDSTMRGCMLTGGYSPQGCYILCDFWCSTNWRIEPDAHGCPAWRWSTRSPAPGENLLCFPTGDALPDRGQTPDAESGDLHPADAID